MSFITKRERVFNEYDLFDLPARNEGKLKAYASCTDARAWSHFCSDKSEHLVEVIKRNNETVRPKYLPTDVIVDTLMVAKNAEITRLKRKIEEFEQMLTAYDQLDLSCDQKCEIAHAHAAIKAANKELYELCLDLDLSGFTEGIDSEGFATGKSRGDEEPPLIMKLSKAVQYDQKCTCEVATLIRDPRVGEMQETIITKDAKLNAMKNTIAVMENDLCEPYIFYAHIFTALEKVFGTLSRNDKYGQYLGLLSAGTDTRCIDVKGKILFRLKVLERFCVALTAPCTKDFLAFPNENIEECACYRVDIQSRTEATTTYALTTAESKMPNLDNKRAQLVADIIENEEMKEILSKENSSIMPDDDPKDEFLNTSHNYNIDMENLNRLKSLQDNFEDLISCYETLKHEKASLEKRCKKYEDMEEELENLKEQLREYNSLWNEKEHFRKRSANLDMLKEQYLVLTDETTNLETQLKAEGEINHIKAKALDSLRSENISLEKKLNEASIAFEKEKNGLLCQLKEADCRIMCQEQQIKSLLQQIDNLIDQDQGKPYSREPDSHALALLDEIESLKGQVKNLRDALFCNEEEKQEFKKHYQNHLQVINELKLEIEDWKNTYEKTLQNYETLESYNERLIEETRHLTQDLDEKSNAVDNLISVIKNKSQEINKLMQDIEKERDQNKNLQQQLHEMQDRFDGSIVSLENEKLQALESLQVARHESHELLDKVKDYDEIVHKKADVTKSLELQLEDNKKLQDLLKATIEENKSLKQDLISQHNNNSILLQEIHELRHVNEYAAKSISSLEDQKKQYEKSLDLTIKESGELKDKIMEYENLTHELQNLQDAHQKLIDEKMRLENELLEKSFELENAVHSIQISKRESDEIIDKLRQSEGSKDSELSRISEALQKLSREKYSVQKDLIEKKREIDHLLQVLDNLKIENEKLLLKCGRADSLEQELEDLKKAFAKLSTERNMLEANKTKEIEKEMNENRKLMKHIKYLETKQAKATNDIEDLQGEKMTTESKLNLIKKESAELVNRIKQYESLELEFEQLKIAHHKMTLEKENLQTELSIQLADLRRMELENSQLHSHSQNLLSHSEDLEGALIGARNELLKKSSVTSEPYQDIMEEIKAMRQEKIKNQKKIRDLRLQLEEADSIMIRLGDDVMARDAQIATLQNTKNQLEEEVFRLHSSLDKVINTGEQMRDFSLEKIDTLHNIEAHHSKATHNMKLELVKLQNENAMLSEQLSVTKADESSRNKYQYAAQIQALEHEREIIITDIKQLELESVGDTAISPNNCDIETILTSIERIRKSFEERTNKSSTLEHTLLQVQTSSQLLASKADEAKKIVEREKQKIISEKEDAIKDKQNMELQLHDLKSKLEKQISKDKVIIEDLEATIKNHKLINDRINKSKDDYISKLEDELQTLRDLYQNSVKRLSEMEQKVQNMVENKSIILKTVDAIKADLEKKSNEVAELQKELESLRKKSESTTMNKIKTENKESQTDKEELPVVSNMTHTTATSATMKDTKEKILDSIYDLEEVNKLPLAKSHANQEQKPKNPMLLNEVQILSVAVDQPFDVIRSSYVDYKMKLLSTGKLEQHSISCFTDNENEISENNATSSPSLKKTRKSGKKYAIASTKGNNLIDIYNRQSMDTNSSKGNAESDNIISGKIADHSQGNSAGLMNESSETDSNINNKYKDSKTSSSGKSTDKDLFIIYKDSEGSYNENKVNSRGTWPGKGRSELIVESVTVHPARKGVSADVHRLKRNIDNKGSFVLQENEEIFDDDGNLSKKLEANLPRIRAESYSIFTTTDVDKSLDSYSLALYSSPKQFSDSVTKFNEDLDDKTIVSLPTKSDDNDQYLESYNCLSVCSDDDTIEPKIMKTAFEFSSGTSKQKRPHTARQKATRSSPSGNVSHHKLSRVGADVLLLKAERDRKNLPTDKRQNFGLEYIMDTVQGEVDPYVESYYSSKDLRKTRSDERFDLVKSKEKSGSSPSRVSDSKVSSTEYKTISINSKSSTKSPPKSYIERSIMAKLDVDFDYQIKINSLSKALETLERDYKKKIEAIKMQYDNNIKSIINEHNQGVKSIQSLHEETLQDIIKLHENEVENLRSLSIEAMKKAERLEKENRVLKLKMSGTTCLDDEPIKMSTPDIKMRRKCRGDTKMLTKTTVEAFNVRPKTRMSGPCTCSIDVNISETIRNIFDQVDVEQRKMAEHTYLKYIANKILKGSTDGSAKADGLYLLDAQELSFLHLKVCRTWKTKLSKEEALQKRIDSLENELMNKQRNTQQHIAELDRKVAEERRLLQEVREAVCRRNPERSRDTTPCNDLKSSATPAVTANTEVDVCGCIAENSIPAVGSRRSAGDLEGESAAAASVPPGLRARRVRPVEINRATIARLDVEERREKKLYNDEPPTRLRRSHDRHQPRVANKK